MPEIERPDRLTPCDPGAVYDCARAEWQDIYQVLPEHRSVLVILAHWAFETGWGHACHVWNVGNRKYVPGCGHDFVSFRASEVVNGVEQFSVMRFVAYDELADGLHDYLVHLRAEFRTAWPAVLAGDPADFAHRLKLTNYYTASEAIYTAGLTSCFARLAQMIPDPLAGLPQTAQAGILADPPEIEHEDPA